MGPDTDKARFVSVEVNGRGDSVMTTKVTDAMARWLLNDTDAEGLERGD